jgi:hypothetical protein
VGFLHRGLATVVLAWEDPELAPRDYEQIVLQLTGHARAVATDVRRLAAALPKSNGRGAFAEIVLREADGGLSAPLKAPSAAGRSRPPRTVPLDTRLERLAVRREAAGPIV